MAKDVKPDKGPGVWMLTTSFNDHDQHGPVPCCVWPNAPSLEELAEFFGHNRAGVQHSNVMGALSFLLRLQNGGGRVGVEHQWYDLAFVPFGKNIERGE